MEEVKERRNTIFERALLPYCVIGRLWSLENSSNLDDFQTDLANYAFVARWRGALALGDTCVENSCGKSGEREKRRGCLWCE